MEMKPLLAMRHVSVGIQCVMPAMRPFGVGEPAAERNRELARILEKTHCFQSTFPQLPVARWQRSLMHPCISKCRYWILVLKSLEENVAAVAKTEIREGNNLESKTTAVES
jgi:hypothetical protein